MIRLFDGADEFRMEISGAFGGVDVGYIATQWRDALLLPAPRRFTVDISQMTDYDSSGRTLLAVMYRHGTQIAGSTPQSLSFLSEISSYATSTLRNSQKPKPPRVEKERNPAPLAALHSVAVGD